jgi:hypothetical protein
MNNLCEVIIIILRVIKIISNNDVEIKHKNNSKSSDILNIEKIYNKIAPYLSNPNYIKEFLEEHKNKSRHEIIKFIEAEMKVINAMKSTDLRILLNVILEKRRELEQTREGD